MDSRWQRERKSGEGGWDFWWWRWKWEWRDQKSIGGLRLLNEASAVQLSGVRWCQGWLGGEGGQTIRCRSSPRAHAGSVGGGWWARGEWVRERVRARARARVLWVLWVLRLLLAAAGCRLPERRPHALPSPPASAFSDRSRMRFSMRNQDAAELGIGGPLATPSPPTHKAPGPWGVALRGTAVTSPPEPVTGPPSPPSPRSMSLSHLIDGWHSGTWWMAITEDTGITDEEAYISISGVAEYGTATAGGAVPCVLSCTVQYTHYPPPGSPVRGPRGPIPSQGRRGVAVPRGSGWVGLGWVGLGFGDDLCPSVAQPQCLFRSLPLYT